MKYPKLFKEKYIKDLFDLDEESEKPRIIFENPSHIFYYASGGHLYYSPEFLDYIERFKKSFDGEILWAFLDTKKWVENVLAGRTLKRHESVSLEVEQSMHLPGSERFSIANPGPIREIREVVLDPYEEKKGLDVNQTLKRLMGSTDGIASLDSFSKKRKHPYKPYLDKKGKVEQPYPYLPDRPENLYIVENPAALKARYDYASQITGQEVKAPDDNRIIDFPDSFSHIIKSDNQRRRTIESWEFSFELLQQRLALFLADLKD